jgi:hypothetical protein
MESLQVIQNLIDKARLNPAFSLMEIDQALIAYGQISMMSQQLEEIKKEKDGK